jgi:protein gp37
VVRFVSFEPAIGPLTPVASFNANSQLIFPDWLICGGESGPRARKMDLDWARDVRNFCIENNISFFFKQWGTEKSNPNPECDSSDNGKGGGLLDGRLWREFPIPRPAALLRV